MLPGHPMEKTPSLHQCWGLGLECDLTASQLHIHQRSSTTSAIATLSMMLHSLAPFYPLSATHCFLASNLKLLTLIWALSHSAANCPSACWKSRCAENNRTASSARSREGILRSLNQTLTTATGVIPWNNFTSVPWPVSHSLKEKCNVVCFQNIKMKKMNLTKLFQFSFHKTEEKLEDTSSEKCGEGGSELVSSSYWLTKPEGRGDTAGKPGGQGGWVSINSTCVLIYRTRREQTRFKQARQQFDV